MRAAKPRCSLLPYPIGAVPEPIRPGAGGFPWAPAPGSVGFALADISWFACAMRDDRPEAVLDFWFGVLDESGRADEEHSSRWWKKDENFDEEIRRRFGTLHAEIVEGRHEDWLDSPKGLLAYVIVLDQFSRNMFRGTAAMFASDEQAVDAASRGIERGFDQKLALSERTFLYMPFMHAERLEAQERCVELFARFADELEGEERKAILGNHDFAIRHHDIVEKWGRFPHRNEILGRDSTEAEIAFLKKPGSSF